MRGRGEPTQVLPEACAAVEEGAEEAEEAEESRKPEARSVLMRFEAHDFEGIGSNPRVAAFPGASAFFESSKLPGAGPTLPD